MTFFLTFVMIGLLSIDLGFTINNRTHDDWQAQEKHKTFMSFLWNFVYWGSLVHGTLLAKFFSNFWQSGHFTVCGKVKASFKVSLQLSLKVETLRAYCWWSNSCDCVWNHHLLLSRVLRSAEFVQGSNSDPAEHLQSAAASGPASLWTLQPASLPMEVR